MSELIDGRKIAKQIYEEIKKDLAFLKERHHLVPGLTVILVGDDPASAVYVKSKAKKCGELGIQSETRRLSAETSEEELLSVIDDLNGDPSVHGILVQLPLPPQIDEARIIQRLDPSKDVDGLHPFSVGLLCFGSPRFIPCTPYGILELLDRSGVHVPGKEVVIVGRSKLVGRPLSLLLSLKNDKADGTVTLCHSRTENLASVCRRADILVAALGRRNSITAKMVKPGAVVIDVGIHRLSSEEGGGLCGDVDFPAVSEIASKITPVPGGVGPMTIAMLMRNTVNSALYSVGNME